MDKTKTQLKKLIIHKFRALENVEIEFGTNITVLCGKNGTSKSSILAIAAQIFSFSKDYTKDIDLAYQTITGASFKSRYSEHFRISNTFDPPGSMQADVELFDGYTGKIATAKFEFMTRGKNPRGVVRNNSTSEADENDSRNFTHPVIFLSLKRLYPIADRDYKVNQSEYFNANKNRFITLTNELLNRSSSNATTTSGTIKSAVAHGNNYDQDSVSAGEDNAGQIILALMSFRKLKEEYADYKGGLLLIDEADAGLFPEAQINLINILHRESVDLKIQVIMTSHSPTLIEYIHAKSKSHRDWFKTIYLSNTYGAVKIMHDMSWPDIYADIHTKTVQLKNDILLPKINVYFEDSEGCDVFKAAMYRQSINKFLNLLDVTMGCGEYVKLIKKNIPEFSERSIICLDPDINTDSKKYSSIIMLPGHLPPDQLIFEYLYNLPADNEIWRNPQRFTKPFLTKIAAEVIRTLEITEDSINLKELICTYRNKQESIISEQKGRKLRDIFKDFYKNQDFQVFVKHQSKLNPWRHWLRGNQSICDEFVSKIKKRFCEILIDVYRIEVNKLSFLESRDNESLSPKGRRK